jgi:hypothetical protein
MDFDMSELKMTLPLFLLLVVIFAGAQSRDINKSRARKPSDEAQKNVEVERILKERRANAQSLLINLAADARNFSDPTLRARTQARIADALWEADRCRSRTIFCAAWEAAELADAEGQRRI